MTRIVSGPRGWSPGQTSTRFADTKPSSFDAKTRTVDCVISMGSPVQRFYGVECLRITPEAVNLDRMKGGSMIPLLDSHQAGGINNALGRFQKIWFNRGALMGQIRFNETANGELAMAWLGAQKSPEFRLATPSTNGKSATKMAAWSIPTSSASVGTRTA
jgi:hypothetical protein